VIASDIPVHREILGDAALYIKLGHPHSWSDAFQSLTCVSTIQTLLNEGKNRLLKFTWNNAVTAMENALLAVEPRLADLQRDHM
jgi:hypothetical protein